MSAYSVPHDRACDVARDLISLRFPFRFHREVRPFGNKILYVLPEVTPQLKSKIIVRWHFCDDFKGSVFPRNREFKCIDAWSMK